MATDKVVMTLIVLVVLGIIGAVASYAVNSRLSGQKVCEQYFCHIK